VVDDSYHRAHICPAVSAFDNGSSTQARAPRYFFAHRAAFGFGYPRRERILCIAALFFSAVLEISQLIIPGRHARFTDFLIDAFGACTGIIAASLLRSMRVQLTT
jgi:hypothetical protein